MFAATVDVCEEATVAVTVSVVEVRDVLNDSTPVVVSLAFPCAMQIAPADTVTVKLQVVADDSEHVPALLPHGPKADVEHVMCPQVAVRVPPVVVQAKRPEEMLRA